MSLGTLLRATPLVWQGVPQAHLLLAGGCTRFSLLTNLGWAKALGAAGFRKANTQYNWPEIARRFRAVYARLAAA